MASGRDNDLDWLYSSDPGDEPTRRAPESSGSPAPTAGSSADGRRRMSFRESESSGGRPPVRPVPPPPVQSDRPAKNRSGQSRTSQGG
ncbi:MAG: hypothetical protein Q4G46_16360, partial [Propionibacteriaceae bacterium]|nr:hypothetical protein [Propionibacteriaceae bacterium]